MKRSNVTQKLQHIQALDNVIVWFQYKNPTICCTDSCSHAKEVCKTGFANGISFIQSAHTVTQEGHQQKQHVATAV